jgi:imidazolonepropionase-like amidohydrolase
MRLLRADRVLTGRPGEVIDDGEVLIDGSQIIHVGARDSAPDEAGTEVIDLTGCTLMPGMIDAHVHLGFDRTVDPTTRRSKESDTHLLLRMVENCRKLLSAGVTTARDLGGRDFLDVTLRDAIESGVAVGPHLVVATRPITHTGGHCWYMGGEADEDEAIRKVARANLRAGADCLKIMATGGAMTPVGTPPWKAQFTTDEIRVAVEEAGMRDKTIAAHAHGTEGIKRATEAGVTTIEHCSFMAPKALLGPPAIDMDVIGQIVDRGIYVCPTVSGVVLKIRDTRGEEWFDAWLSRLNCMREAGVKLVAGTDAGFGGATGIENRMDDFVDSLELFATAGWDNAGVIEAATVLAAEACGIGEVAGSLDEGKRADLLVVRGDPSVNLGDLRQIELVMVSGRAVTQTGVATVASSGGLD